jgi:hypothetical protein
MMLDVGEQSLILQPAVDEAEIERHFASRSCPHDHETVRCWRDGWLLVYCPDCEPAELELAA